MANSFNLPSLCLCPLVQKTTFLSPKQTSFMKLSSNKSFIPQAKFNIYEILGGRGLCNGEEGVLKELEKPVSQDESSAETSIQETEKEKELLGIPEEGFEKEMLGLTGGFPGGEKGLQKFIEENPPTPKTTEPTASVGLVRKALAPELPLLLPGMIAIVKNTNSPYYMYCGIVQRITDGKAGVLFEGGNWDRLITFRLEELQRRQKGPPMVSPRSVILEKMLEKTDP